MGFFDDISDDNLAQAAAKTTPSSGTMFTEAYDDGYDEEAVGSGFSESGEYDIPDDAFGEEIYVGDEEIDIMDDYEQILDEELPAEEAFQVEATATFEEVEEQAPAEVVKEAPAKVTVVEEPKPVTKEPEPVVEVAPTPTPKPKSAPAPAPTVVNRNTEKPKKKPAPAPVPTPGRLSQITATVVGGGAVVNGDVASSGPVSIEGIVRGSVSGSQVAVFKNGQVEGSLTSEGKVDVKGYVGRGVTGSEIAISDCKIVGPVSGSEITIFEGAVVIGDITGDNLVVSGAIKGDTDVKERVLLSPTAIVKGNITSAKIIIEDGAAIEGTVTQTYARVSPSAFFDNE